MLWIPDIIHFIWLSRTGCSIEVVLTMEPLHNGSDEIKFVLIVDSPRATFFSFHYATENNSFVQYFINFRSDLYFTLRDFLFTFKIKHCTTFWRCCFWSKMYTKNGVVSSYLLQRSIMILRQLVQNWIWIELFRIEYEVSNRMTVCAKLGAKWYVHWIADIINYIWLTKHF